MARPESHPDPSLETDSPCRAAHRRIAAYIGLAVLLLGIAGNRTKVLQRLRHRSLPGVSSYSPDTPPMVVFATVALGGFRGIIADLLWLRAAQVQQQGRYVELAQLSEWITALDPHNGEVWAYHAWNLAYNVSVMMSRPEDRWRWVRSGIDLLQEKGVRLNPANAQVRRELAWIFQHKLGTDMDTAATFYRREWARLVSDYLEPDGSPPRPESLNDAEMPDALGLDPARMRDLDARFGPLDWRVPCAHAVYWALEALDRAGPRERLPCRRLVYQSLILMIRGDGRMLGDPGSDAFVFRAVPNEDLLEGTIAFLEETHAEHFFQGVRMAFAGLLVEGMRIDARRGRDPAARTKYDRAVELAGNPGAIPPIEALLAGEADVDWELFSKGL